MSARETIESFSPAVDELFRTIANSSPIGMFVMQDGRFEFVNPKFEEATGYSAGELVGRDALMLVHPEDASRVRDCTAKMLEGKRSAPFEYRIVHKGGVTRWILGRVTCLPVRGRQAILGYAVDVTDRKQTEQMQSDFLSFLTHQLRTPLAGIKWLLELAADAPDVSEEARSYITDAQEANEGLIGMVNDLLEVSRLERGKIPMAPQETDLDELTQGVLEELRPQIAEKGHRLSVTRAAAVPRVWADPQLLRRVVLQLAANAIKYAPPGGDIVIRMGREGAAIRWAIQDSGVGIPREAQRRLFERFHQPENVLTLENERTGQSLYWIRLSLEQCGGRVWCESEGDKGATFLFTVPLPRSG